MGDRVPGPLCGDKVGAHFIDGGTLCRTRSSPPGPTKGRTAHDSKRRRAVGLRAADAHAILQAALPLVLKQMSDRQLEQMQRVLDAGVVNPEVQKEANDFYRRAIVAQSGSVYIRDERMERRGDHAMKSLIPVKEADKRIRLNYKALLAPDALNVTTDNPDERAYLHAVKKTLEAKGVWLRFTPKRVRDPDDPSRYVVDYRQFDVWISLGPDGDMIPTDNGRLTREILLKTTVLGAGYYQRVHRGPVQSALEKDIRRLRDVVEDGLAEHVRLVNRYEDAAPLVAQISDFVGGADLPDIAIWKKPEEFVKKAFEMSAGGNINASLVFLLTGGFLAYNAGRLLADYVKASNAGAEFAATFLEVVEVVVIVAGSALVVTQWATVASGGAKLLLDGTAERVVATIAAEDAAAEPAVQYWAEFAGKWRY